MYSKEILENLDSYATVSSQYSLRIKRKTQICSEILEKFMGLEKYMTHYQMQLWLNF